MGVGKQPSSPTIKQSAALGRVAMMHHPEKTFKRARLNVKASGETPVPSTMSTCCYWWYRNFATAVVTATTLSLGLIRTSSNRHYHGV